MVETETDPHRDELYQSLVELRQKEGEKYFSSSVIADYMIGQRRDIDFDMTSTLEILAKDGKVQTVVIKLKEIGDGINPWIFNRNGYRAVI